jgi:hypothetical protein
MATVFISHTSGDDTFVARVAQRLESAGVKVWIDSGRIVPGDDILQKVEQGLADATHVIVVFSPASLLSDWVREESHAGQLAAIAGNSRIIPVIYGAISPSAIPLLLRSRLYVDFRDPKQFERSIAQLLSAFAPFPEQPQPASSLQIVDFQIARRPKDGATAIELLLNNPNRRTPSIKKLSLRSRIPYPVAYAMLPPTVVFPLSLTIGPRTANGIVVVGGAIGHEAEEWRRPVGGKMVFAPYHTDFVVDLPLYLAIGPREEVLLRIPFESVVTGAQPKEEVHRPLLREAGDEERFYDGTRITIEASEGAISSFVSAGSLLVALVPLMADFPNDEFQLKFRRRVRA